MKTILRNFLPVFKRFKMAMLLNIAGLAVAFAAFIVILVQVDYEQSFDRCHPTAERVFRVDLTTTGTFSTILPRAFVEAVISSSPHIQAGSLLCPFVRPIYLTVTENGEKKGFRESVLTCHPELVKVFEFPLIEGNADCLNDPEKIVLPESIARKMYGEGSVVGKTMRAEEDVWSKGKAGEWTVGGVYRDFPENTQLRNVIYTGIDPEYGRMNFQASNYVCYLLLDDPAHATDVADNFNRHFDFSKIGDSGLKIKLVPLTDIYYLNESQDGMVFRSGNREVTLLLLGIALLIIIVAAINFTNFSTALMPLRIKSINTRKVLGSSLNELRGSLLGEAAIISLVAWLFSLFLVWILQQTSALPFVEADLSFGHHIGTILLSGLIAVATGVIAGIYPAWYTTSVPPALVLKGSFGLSPSGRRLRTLLIGVQFIVSLLLIIGSGFVHLQNDYMRGFSLGFDKDQIAIVELNGDLYQKHHETYANRLKEFAGIEDVAFAMEKVGSKDVYNTNTIIHKGKEVQYFMIIASANFLDVMGIPVEEGRNFSVADEKSSEPVFIFNRPARLAADMEVGERSHDGRIVGFTGEVKFSSLRGGENNIAFTVMDMDEYGYTLNNSYIRLKAGTDVHAAVDHIRRTLAAIDPAYPFEIEFYDTVFNNLYQKEEHLRGLVLVFSILAILISLVGVFGLVVFDTQYRRKEIGVRKVHGATVEEILWMFNKAYIRIVAICFVIAAPLAWFGVRKWLENFAYKTPLYLWVFFAAFLVVLLITLATVSFQNWKAAHANPVKSLRSE